MRLNVRFPQVEPKTYEMPETCPYGCGGRSIGGMARKGNASRYAT